MKSLENYVEVHVRISQFWERHPEGAILTELDFPDENTVRCRARVYRTEGAAVAATGHAEERRDQGMVNKTSAVENCETSAVGRALALMGYSIHKGIASREEVEIAQRKAQAQKNTSQAGRKPQDLPERYVDWLRLAIRSYDHSELADETEWRKLVDAAKDKASNERLVKSLEAALSEVGGNVEQVRERFRARQQVAA